MDQNRTTVWLWAGPQSGLKGAESIYNLIHEELEKTATARPPVAEENVAQ